MNTKKAQDPKICLSFLRSEYFNAPAVLKNQNLNLNYPYGIIESVANVFTSNLLNDCSFQITFFFIIDPYMGFILFCRYIPD